MVFWYLKSVMYKTHNNGFVNKLSNYSMKISLLWKVFSENHENLIVYIIIHVKAGWLVKMLLTSLFTMSWNRKIAYFTQGFTLEHVRGSINTETEAIRSFNTFNSKFHEHSWFLEQIIFRKSTVDWTPRSCDLTALY